MGGKKKNPLSQLFGEFLRHERNRLSLTGQEIANRLELGASFYRMIESGNANMNPNRLPFIIRAFEDSEISFERLNKLLIGIQFIEYYNDEEKGRTTEDGLIYLESLDKDFHTLLKKEPENLHHRDIEAFLKDKHYAPAESAEFRTGILNEILTTKTLYIELLLNMTVSLKKHPPMHIEGIASSWEEENKHLFTSLVGVYKDHKIIISKKNFQHFTFPYLLNEKFETLRFIFLDSKRTEFKELEDHFFDTLNEVRKEKQLPLLTERQKDKISFRCTKVNPESLTDKLFEPEDFENSSPLSAFWSFSTAIGGNIAFTGVRKKSVDFIINLTLEQTIKRNKIFEELWSELK